MASLTFMNSLHIPRWQSHYSVTTSSELVQLCILKYSRHRVIKAFSKKNLSQSGAEDSSNGTVIPVEKTTKRTKKTSRNSKKANSETSVENESPGVVSGVQQEESSETVSSSENAKKGLRRSKKEDAALTDIEAEFARNKEIRRMEAKERIRKFMENPGAVSESEMPTIQDLGALIPEPLDEVEIPEWPPLVLCFGAIRNCFIPSGRPANRWIDHEMHESFKYMEWSPPKFVRAPGGSPSSVAIALASLGTKVAFMGKVGHDTYGFGMLNHLNSNNVQTQPVRLVRTSRTALSYMKISRRGGLKLSCVKACAEDSFLSSEIDIDVLKEAKMFYFDSSSLLDEGMRSTTMYAVRVCKHFGGVIFFDLNLPLPLWQSNKKTKALISEAWNSADFIEVTKQELEFLRGIQPAENFDTKDNDPSKFVHYEPDVIKPLWHENLKVLFVTNGTTKISYYTETHDGAIRGVEDAAITPFTCEMSTSGDHIVAALMTKLSQQPHLVTDPRYLEEVVVEYALSCGFQAQWVSGRFFGFPLKEGMEYTDDLEKAPLAEMGMGYHAITEKEYMTMRPPYQV